MGAYNSNWFPGSNINELNLDYILKAIKENTEKVNEVYKKYTAGELTGRGLNILGVFSTLDDLQTQIKNPAIGDAYAVGTADDYIVYIWTVSDNTPNWVNFGTIRGPKGDAGADGRAATLQVVSTSTLVAGSNAYVRNTGTTSDVTLAFGIPRGFNGDSPTISVGSVTSLPSTSEATIENVGTSTDAVFNFGIPRGADGKDGSGVPSGGASGDVLTPSGWENLINLIYPIGSIYLSANETSPETLFASTQWEKIENKFLLSSSDSYPLNSTGGSTTHLLTKAELPNIGITMPGIPATSEPEWGEPNQMITYRYSPSAAPGAFIASLGGSSTPFSIMPPYIAINVWKRIA